MFDNFRDPRTKSNAKHLVNQIIAHGSSQIWLISADRNEYERFVNVLSKPSEEGICPEELNTDLMDRALPCFNGKAVALLVHDFCDIRKRYSQKLEGLSRVKSLEGDIINGFETFNSVGLTKGQIHFLGCTPIDTRDRGVLEESENFHKKAAFSQIKDISKKFRALHPDQVLVHLIDREADDLDYFDFFDKELGDKFVLRLKLNRNSVLKTWNDAKGKEVSIKLKDQHFANRSEVRYERFIWKNKVYQDAKAVIQYDTMVWAGASYWVLKVELLQRNGEAIFAEPMLLVTNLHLASDKNAQHIYHYYLQRSRIEGVFKFLKTNLGWENFRLRDFIPIRNILAIVFWTGAHFYEQRADSAIDEFIGFVCGLAKSKGKTTRHFFLKGLAILANYQIAQQHFKEQGWEQEAIDHFVENKLNIINSLSNT